MPVVRAENAVKDTAPRYDDIKGLPDEIQSEGLPLSCQDRSPRLGLTVSSFLLYNVPNGDMLSDLWLQQLWMSLYQSGELKTLVHPTAQSLSGFFMLLRKALPCIYLLDKDQKIWYLAWYEPCFSGAFFSMWVSPELRGTFKHLEAVVVTYKDIGFKLYPTLMGVTCQEHLLPLHVKLGYMIAAKIPKLWGGKDCWLMTVDQTDFENSRLYKTYLKMGSKGA